MAVLQKTEGGMLLVEQAEEGWRCMEARMPCRMAVLKKTEEGLCLVEQAAAAVEAEVDVHC